MKITSIASTIPSSSYFVTFFSVAVLALVVMYMYLLSMSVVEVVLRKELVQNIRQTESEIAKLESAYILAQHAVSEKIASVTYLTETNEKIFVQRAPSTLVFSQINQ